MREPNDLELIEHWLGRGSPAPRQELDAALAGSAELRRRRDALAGVWRLLGEVDVETPGRDLWPGVSERLPAQLPRSIKWRLPGSISWWAAAAAVTAAILVGHGSARLRLAWQPKASHAPVEDSEVVATLGLTHFDQGSLQQLGKDLLENQTQNQTQGST